MEIKSPLTGTGKVEKIAQMTASSIIGKYRDNYGMDVSRHFRGHEQVCLYLCRDTGYRFFTPGDIAGDGRLYRDLQAFPWYYRGDKWEHKVALARLQKGQKLLEIGCGRGDFLGMAAGVGAVPGGIEFNSDAAAECRRRGFPVLAADLAEAVKGRSAKYDVVCAFQVLEHLAEPAEFFANALKLMKPGGQLIISVPNNDSFIYQQGMDGGLNLPPHHMGWWDARSLLSLQRLYPLRLEALHQEPLAPDGLPLLGEYFKRAAIRDSLLGKVRCRGARKEIANGLEAMAKHLAGHSLVAVYSRPGRAAARSRAG